MKFDSKWVPLLIIGGLLVLCCCVMIVVLSAGGILFSNLMVFSNNNVSTSEPASSSFPWTATPYYYVTETPIPVQVESQEILPTSESSAHLSDPQGAVLTLKILEDEILPENDLRELAMRLEGKEDIPEVMPGDPVKYQTGDLEAFWVTNVDTNDNFQVNTRLAYATAHAYYWVEEGVDYNFNELKLLADTFENQIYPTDREFFGSEWTPGIDNDEHLYIIYAGNLGVYLGGYFSSVDSVHPDAHEYSNGHETFVFNSDTVPLSDTYTYGVLAHEFQHMIHWYRDKNESTWLNEGFSELAVFLNGYGVGGKDYYYAFDPDLQLNNWANEVGDATGNYGASFLFVTYLLDRFGEDVTKAVVAHPENGFESLDAVFDEMDIQDSDTGELMTAEEFYRDWTLANYLKDEDIRDGRYIYEIYPNSPDFSPTEEVVYCDLPWQDRDVHQFGVDYIHFSCSGPVTLSFEGRDEVRVVSADPHSGDYMFWSNKGDESDMTLTRSFDFSELTSEIFLNYWVWYDLEEDYDYLYLQVSIDGGENWRILYTPSGTSEDPSGNSYGYAYNGQSGRWINEQINLSEFAGKEITLRFEYVTDAAVNGEGLLLDDISIDAAGYFSDFEENEGGWDGAGFVRIQNRLPQSYLVSLILDGQETEVQEISLDENQRFEQVLDFGPDLTNVTLVVSGSTRFTWVPAEYRFKLQQ